MKLKLVKLREDASLPTKGSKGSAGWDVYFDGDASKDLKPGETFLYGAGFALGIPENHAVLVLARSGMGVKKQLSITQAVGLIDSDYRGEIKIALKNKSDQVVTISPGTRVAQLVLVETPSHELEMVDTLDDTDRGEGGFGSTDKVEEEQTKKPWWVDLKK